MFPIMEMILEEIMNEKLRKVGERVRHYSKVMEDSYKAQLAELESQIIVGSSVGGPAGVGNGMHDELD